MRSFKGNNGNSPRPRQFSPRPSPLLLRVRKLLPAERKEEEEERGEGCMIVLKYSLTTVNVKLDQKLIKMHA